GFSVLPTIRVSYETPDHDGSNPPPNRYLSSTLLSLEQGAGDRRAKEPGGMAARSLEEYLGRHAEQGDDVQILIFDQFEELLTVDPANQRAKADYLTEVGSVLRNRRRWAIFVMREDMIAGLDPYLPLLPTGLGTRFRLDLLTREPA